MRRSQGLSRRRRRIPRLEELAPPECEEEQDGDSEIDAEARQEGRDLAQRKPGQHPLAPARGLGLCCSVRHGTTLGASRRPRIARNYQLGGGGRVVISDHASALAAVREETPSLAKMFCR